MSLNDYSAYADWKKWSTDSFFSVSPIESAYFDAEFSRLATPVEAGKDVLEIGFGNGSFAAWSANKGLNYVGSELLPALVSRAVSVGLRAYSGDAEAMFTDLGVSSIDIAVAFDVFEHLELHELEAMLQLIYKGLRPGGVLLARVPSGDSPFGRVIFHGDITHRLALGSSAVRQLADRHGFEVEDIGEPRLPIKGVGIRRALRRMLVLAARKLMNGVINVVYHDGKSAVMTGNLVFVFKKPAQAGTTYE